MIYGFATFLVGNIFGFFVCVVAVALNTIEWKADAFGALIHSMVNLFKFMIVIRTTEIFHRSYELCIRSAYLFAE